METWINLGLIVTYVLFAIAVISFIGFPLLYTLRNFQNAKKGLLGILAIAVILFFAYIISPADQGVFYENFHISAGQSKLIGGGLIATYLLMIILIVYLVYSEVIKWFR